MRWDEEFVDAASLTEAEQYVASFISNASTFAVLLDALNKAWGEYATGTSYDPTKPFDTGDDRATDRGGP
jgi:hypothetical protein